MLDKIRGSRCFSTPKVTKREAQAIKALAAGEATEFEQKLALAVIVNKFSRPHDVTYVPDSDSQSTFLSGRAFVGMKLLKIIKIPIGKLDINEEAEDDE